MIKKHVEVIASISVSATKFQAKAAEELQKVSDAAKDTWTQHAILLPSPMTKRALGEPKLEYPHLRGHSHRAP